MVKSLGYVTVTAPGTPVRATVNEQDPTLRVGAQAMLVQAKPDNTGVLYVGTAGMDKATGVGVIGFVGVPASESAPSFSVGLPTSATGLSASDYYLDGDDAGDVALVTITQG